MKTVANYRLLIDELTDGALIVSNAYYIVNALKIKDDNDLKFTIIATAGVSLLFQVAIAIFFCRSCFSSIEEVQAVECAGFVPRNLEPEILSLRFGAYNLVPKREI